jgi:hypothetical protein
MAALSFGRLLHGMLNLILNASRIRVNLRFMHVRRSAGEKRGGDSVITLRLRRNLESTLFLLAAASLSLYPGSAVAQLTTCAAGSVCYYVAVQPIDVCPTGATTSNPTGCAPFNTVSRTGSPGTVGSTNPIGFVDATTGKDITRAMANQIGVDIAWQPMRLYANTSSQSIAVDSCTTTSCSSTAFSALTDQKNIATGLAPTPSPPLNSVATVLNMFFVNQLVPPSTSPGTLYGFAWIGNNGIAISSNTFFPPYPLTPRYDTLAHELHHNLGLNHADLYNYDGTAPASDLMTTGSARTEPTSTSNAVTQLGNGRGSGSADQLDCNSTSCTRSTSDFTVQQAEVATTGFLNPIQTTTTTVTKGK